MSRLVHKVRRWFYERGHRPKYGTILYSPSLNWIYIFQDANLPEAFAKGIKQGQERGL